MLQALCTELNRASSYNFLHCLYLSITSTRDTDNPTSIAGRIPELNRFVSKYICPSVIDITFVGIYAEHHLPESQLSEEQSEITSGPSESLEALSNNLL